MLGTHNMSHTFGWVSWELGVFTVRSTEEEQVVLGPGAESSLFHRDFYFMTHLSPWDAGTDQSTVCFKDLSSTTP